MPSIPSGSKVLVSGANGYLAIWVVRTLLERGYSVRGTVRSLDKANYLKKTFASYGDKLEFIVVKDIAAKGAFDEAVKGVDAIQHTASPFHLQADDPQELIGPAVSGTVGILESVVKNGPSVKRIVVTSSVAAIMRPSPTPLHLTAEDWNENSIQLVEAQGKNAPAFIKYAASKTLAEKAAWEFYNKHKASAKWDLTVINPPMIFGPVIHEVSSYSTLNTSSQQFYNIVVTPNAGGKSNEELATEGANWVDVRDAAEAHVLALEKEAAGGERILITAGRNSWQDWLDSANSLTPSPIPLKALPKGDPVGAKNHAPPIHYLDASKAVNILGLKFRTAAETTRDSLADFAARGW